MTSNLTPLARPDSAGARMMASAWAEFFAALWRGDATASAFAEWLAGFWEPSLPRPSGAADGRNPFAAGGRDIEWFERDGWVMGLIPGRDGGYLVPRAAIEERFWASLLAPAA